jgi:hypothetical protein
MSLLGGGHGDALASLGTTTTKDFTTTAGLLASTESVGTLAALVVGLISALHGWLSGYCGGDRYSSGGVKSS